MTTTELSAARKADRAEMAGQVAALAREYGLSAEIRPEQPGSRRVLVYLAGPHGLRLTVHFDAQMAAPDTYVLNWYGVDDGVRLNPGVFGNVNAHHGHKATDVARGFLPLFRVLRERFSAVRYGSAFVTEPASAPAGTEPLSPRAARRREAERFAAELGIDPDALERGTSAAWSHMNPQSFSWGQALSLAGAVLAASGTHAPPF